MTFLLLREGEEGIGVQSLPGQTCCARHWNDVWQKWQLTCGVYSEGNGAAVCGDHARIRHVSDRTTARRASIRNGCRPWKHPGLALFTLEEMV